MYLKFTSISTQAGFLKSTAYDSFVSSTVITGLKKDGIFNDLATAYTNIRFLQSAFGIVLSDFEIKLRVHHHALEKNGRNEYVGQILQDLGKKIKDNTGKELAISYRSVCIAVDSVDKYLNTMMVKSDEDKKSDSDLTKKDKEFVENILRKSPEKIPLDIFEDQEA